MPEASGDAIARGAGGVYSEVRLMRAAARDVLWTQKRAASWHRRRFPDATQERVALKLGSECGELQDAVVAFTSRNEHPERADQIGAEAADVMIVVMVLLQRYHPEIDLMAEVDAKLNVLEARQRALQEF